MKVRNRESFTIRVGVRVRIRVKVRVRVRVRLGLRLVLRLVLGFRLQSNLPRIRSTCQTQTRLRLIFHRH